MVTVICDTTVAYTKGVQAAQAPNISFFVEIDIRDS